MEWLDKIWLYIKLSTNVSNFKNKIGLPFEYKTCNVNKCLCTVQWLNYIKKIYLTSVIQCSFLLIFFCVLIFLILWPRNHNNHLTLVSKVEGLQVWATIPSESLLYYYFLVMLTTDSSDMLGSPLYHWAILSTAEDASLWCIKIGYVLG